MNQPQHWWTCWLCLMGSRFRSPNKKTLPPCLQRASRVKAQILFQSTVEEFQCHEHRLLTYNRSHNGPPHHNGSATPYGLTCSHWWDRWQQSAQIWVHKSTQQQDSTMLSSEKHHKRLCRFPVNQQGWLWLITWGGNIKQWCTGGRSWWRSMCNI